MFEDGISENPTYKVRVVQPDSQTNRRVANENESLMDNKDTSRAHVNNIQTLDACAECKGSSSNVQKPGDDVLVNNQEISQQMDVKDENETWLVKTDNRCNLETVSVVAILL